MLLMQDVDTHGILPIHNNGTNDILIEQYRVHMECYSHMIGHMFFLLHSYRMMANNVFYSYRMITRMVFTQT